MRETMPKYHYACKSCSREWWEWRGMSEPDLENCSYCNRPTVTKIPTTFVTVNKTHVEGDKKVGETTKEYIEENREVLKQMKKEAQSTEFK